VFLRNSPETIKKNLITKLSDHTASVGIIGLGYVGLPLSITFAKKGYKIYGFDKDEYKINHLKNLESYIRHISSDEIHKAFSSNNHQFSTSFENISKCDALIICVPTPLSKYRDPDLSYITNTLDMIKNFLHEKLIISLESTTYPGTTEEILLPFLSSLGYRVGEDIFLVYSPEREDPGNKTYSTVNIPKVVGGITPNCLEVGKYLYQSIINEVVEVSNTRTAEMTKLLENIHRSVNIGLVNELKPLANAMSIDIFEVINAAATKPFGFVPYYPGPGLGGHCIPIDPFYLTWKAREFGMHTKFIELAGEINSQMPYYVYNRAQEALNTAKLSINQSKILILGLAYKKNVDDYRESPSVLIIESLAKSGAKVSFSDPYIKSCPEIDKLLSTNQSIDLDEKTISSFDLVILLTDHDCFDYQLILNSSSLIVDTRGKFNASKKILTA
tara:strand:+ start:993 stop:2324 length:1332 start_codon:yes stop_codon:yes gene_type:complete